MSALLDSLQYLFQFLEKGGNPSPSLDVLLIEIGHDTATDDRGRLRIRRDALRKPSDYESRFEELLHSGMPWLNVSCYGVYEGFLIVSIEIPQGIPENARADRLSINYSGPPLTVIQHGWDVTEIAVIED